jgi:putative membrane protein
MRFLLRLVLYVCANTVALVAASRVVSGFSLQGDYISVLGAAALLTVLHLILRPILRFLISPLVLLTFGFAVIALNAFLLHLLDIWSAHVTITGTLPLLYATIIVGLVNMALGILGWPFLGRRSSI